MDCANGSASRTAERLFTELGAQVYMLSDQPNGVNINDNCGSTHMESLMAFVKENHLDAGVAFDGDADRCLAVDNQGNLVDGDFVMAICALDMKSRGKLAKNTVVGTIMTNMGFIRFCEENGMNFVATKVGDRYVLEEMLLEEYSFGGEQSGHVIFLDFGTTGDGQLTAAQLIEHPEAAPSEAFQLGYPDGAVSPGNGQRPGQPRRGSFGFIPTPTLRPPRNKPRLCWARPDGSSCGFPVRSL